MDRFDFPSSFMHRPMMSAGGTRFTSKPRSEKKSHSEAESRRRKRINDRLATLRGILPSKVKTDKATLLMETVQHVRELQRKVAELAGISPQLPTEFDSVNVSRCENDDDGNNSVDVKATVCCEDREELNRDLVQLIRSVRGELTRTEMATVCGRTRVVMSLKLERDGGGEEKIGRLRRGLRAVAENRVPAHSTGIGLTESNNKRGRFVVSNRTGLLACVNSLI